MSNLRILSAAEQVSAHLREELATGVRRDEMLGAVALAAELGVNHKTMEAALGLLVREGLLVNGGAGKPRRILPAVDGLPARRLRVGILLHQAMDRRLGFIEEINHLLGEKGHAPFYAKRSLTELGMDRGKVAAFVNRTPADAWVVVAAPRMVLEWFATTPLPAFGLFGFRNRISIATAGPDKVSAYAEVVRALVAYGHRRIVLLARPQRRNPLPGIPERSFLQALGEAGIQVGDYHFPDWENTRQGCHQRLENLFRTAPPTALVVQEVELLGVVLQFFAERGVRVPGDVSVVCTDPDPSFAWRIPSVAHISWDSGKLVRRVVGWADNVARGKDDRRRLLTRAEFVTGGTIGPVRKKESWV